MVRMVGKGQSARAEEFLTRCSYSMNKLEAVLKIDWMESSRDRHKNASVIGDWNSEWRVNPLARRGTDVGEADKPR